LGGRVASVAPPSSLLSGGGEVHIVDYEFSATTSGSGEGVAGMAGGGALAQWVCTCAGCAARDGCRRVERTEVVVVAGCGWQPGRPWGLGSSPLPSRSHPRRLQSALVKSPMDWEDSLLGSPPLPLAPGHVCGSGWQCVGDRLGCHEARQLPLIAPLRWLLAASTKKDQWPSRPSEGLEVGRCGSPKVGCVLAVVVCVRSRLLFVVLCVFALLRVMCLFLDEMKCNSPEFLRKKNI
jgi:hypothetical protein